MPHVNSHEVPVVSQFLDACMADQLREVRAHLLHAPVHHQRNPALNARADVHVEAQRHAGLLAGPVRTAARNAQKHIQRIGLKTNKKTEQMANVSPN